MDGEGCAVTFTIRTSVSKHSCASCGSRDFVLNPHEELVCTTCGQVITRLNVEEGPEWRPFLPESESRIRVGSPPTPLLRDKGMSTFIGFGGRDAGGRRMRGRLAADMTRLRAWQNRLRAEDTKQRNLSTALRLINRVGERLELPYGLLEEASHIYRRALQQNMVRGRTIAGLVTGSLYVAIRSQNLPWTPRDVSEASGVDKGEITKNYRLLVNHLGLKIPVIDPLPYVRRICAQLGLERRVDLAASRILRTAQEKRLTAGKAPTASAAGAIYYACRVLGVDVDQRTVAKAAGTTEVTIKNHYDLLKEKVEPKVPIATPITHRGVPRGDSERPFA